ncbi:beta-propeller fold lactonase family protein [Spirillospora sp. NPDC047279]|uniref:lactonase family protein n=1 Tax=Spirillospora sp. NPDC047279 TaxID=3155478 RepID=UPI0033C4509C
MGKGACLLSKDGVALRIPSSIRVGLHAPRMKGNVSMFRSRRISGVLAASLLAVGGLATPAHPDGPATVGAAASDGRTVYVTNSANLGGTANVTRFAVGGSGGLKPVDGVEVGDGAGARSMVFTPELRFAYLANTAADQVVLFRIAANGALERFGMVETPGPFAMAIAPNGKTIYVSNTGTRTVSPFAVGSEGELTPLRPVDTGAKAAKGVAVTPDGRFVYVSHGSPSDIAASVMTGFAVLPDGALGREVAREKIGISGAETVITPDGRFVYVVNQGSDDVHGFRIGSHGGLTPVPGSPVGTGDFPEGAAISPDGLRLYVAAVGVAGNDPDALAGQVLGFTIGDDGRLVENVERVGMSSPIGLGFSANGRYLHVSDYTDSKINTFAVALDGELDLIQRVNSNGPRPAFHSVNVLPREDVRPRS